MNKIEEIRNENLKTDIPDFSIGDDLEVEIRIIEGGKERKQIFKGTVIARSGRGIGEAVTLRHVSYGQGVERVLPLHSPRVAGIHITRQGREALRDATAEWKGFYQLVLKPAEAPGV